MLNDIVISFVILSFVGGCSNYKNWHFYICTYTLCNIVIKHTIDLYFIQYIFKIFNNRNKLFLWRHEYNTSNLRQFTKVKIELIFV